MKTEHISDKVLFHRCLKYGKRNFGYIPNNAVSRARFYDILIKHGVIKGAGYKNKTNDSILCVKKNFTFEDDRHNRRCTIRFLNGDTIIIDKNGRFWL